MILSDKDIVNELQNPLGLSISPWNESMIQPCSVDLHLADELKTINGKTIDLSYDSYKLKPNEFILGATYETVRIPKYLCGQVDGRSSIGRLGCFVHVSAGFIDAGYEGNITLELYNASDKELELCNHMDIAQIVLFTLTSECVRPYGSYDLNSKYQGSDGVVLSKYDYDG